MAMHTTTIFKRIHITNTIHIILYGVSFYKVSVRLFHKVNRPVARERKYFYFSKIAMESRLLCSIMGLQNRQLLHVQGNLGTSVERKNNRTVMNFILHMHVIFVLLHRYEQC